MTVRGCEGARLPYPEYPLALPYLSPKLNAKLAAYNKQNNSSSDDYLEANVNHTLQASH